MNPFPKGDPDDPKSEAFRAMYELALRKGNKLYGSECKHERVKRGRCLDCQRKVFVKKVTK